MRRKSDRFDDDFELRLPRTHREIDRPRSPHLTSARMRNRIRKIWAGAWLCVSIAAAALCASCSEDTTAVHRLDAGTEASKDSGSTGQCAAWIDLTVARWFVDGGLEVGANTENACTWPLDGALASASRAEVQFRIPPEKGFAGAPT